MSGTRSSSMHIRVNPNIKAKAAPVLEAIGLSFSDAFNLMLHQIALKRRIPFEMTSVQLTENGYTEEQELKFLAEMEEFYADVAAGKVKAYNSVEELFADMDAEDAEDDE